MILIGQFWCALVFAKLRPGFCSRPQLLSEFNYNDFEGLWYLIKTTDYQIVKRAECLAISIVAPPILANQTNPRYPITAEWISPRSDEPKMMNLVAHCEPLKANSSACVIETFMGPLGGRRRWFNLDIVYFNKDLGLLIGYSCQQATSGGAYMLERLLVFSRTR